MSNVIYVVKEYDADDEYFSTFEKAEAYMAEQIARYDEDQGFTPDDEEYGSYRSEMSLYKIYVN